MEKPQKILANRSALLKKVSDADSAQGYRENECGLASKNTCEALQQLAKSQPSVELYCVLLLWTVSAGNSCGAASRLFRTIPYPTSNTLG
jgi:hypothetical protein